MPSSPTAEALAERVARQSYGKLVAYLAARSRDVASAEDALSEAFATALRQWPRTGTPDNPEAWLLTVARRKQIDAARRRKTSEIAGPHMQFLAEDLAAAEAGHMPIPDQRLALMFACAHPAIDPAVRTPLILQTVLGFDAAAIASAFLVSPATMSQRLVRAKAKIKEAGIPFQIPQPDVLPERLDAVLDAIYACFGDGWTDATGSEPARREHAGEAIWLGQLLAGLLAQEAEVHGLQALMLYAESRRAARRDAYGTYVPLSGQDPKAWNGDRIAEANVALMTANRLPGQGRFQLQAAIQSVHAARRETGRTDWAALVQLYDILLEMTGSAVVAINRAVAVAELEGARAGLAALSGIEPAAAVEQYQPYWAAKARLLALSGEPAAADAAYALAIGLESDPAVRAFLQKQRQALRQ
jgi:RNA polymerase sigma-70 factor, ECF subfamily